METRSKLLEQIREAKEDLEKAQKRLEELEKMSPEQQLATEIHNHFCVHNHTDGCGWCYEDWSAAGQPHSTKGRYLAKAEQVLKVTDFDTAMKLVGILGRH